MHSDVFFLGNESSVVGITWLVPKTIMTTTITAKSGS